jgi:hypothetical protein
MIHKSATLVIILFLAVGSFSCGKNKEQQADTASIPGTVKESAAFKILVPEGWEFSTFNDGTVQTYDKSGTYMVEAKKGGMNMTEKDVEMVIGTLAKQYNGTPLETVEMLGLKFYKTSYEAFSKKQTMYNALKGGQKISIALMGPEHQTDPKIQAVLKSIVLK